MQRRRSKTSLRRMVQRRAKRELKREEFVSM